MARYLVAGWPFPGELHPRVAVALALRARGHDVAFYTGARASDMLADLGFVHFPLRHVDEAVYQHQNLYENDAPLAEWRRLRATLRTLLIDSIPGQLADLEPILDSWQPDAIIGDLAMLAPFLILHETRSIPVAMVCMSLGSMVSGPDAPPWGRGLPPPNTRRRRALIGVERVAVRMATREFRSAANVIRARYGLAPLSVPISDYAGTMPLYLVSSVRELDYNRRDQPSQVHYVGRLAWERRSDQPPPPWIDELPADKPLVYVTEGTIHGQRSKLLQAAASGLAGQPLQVLLTLTPDRDPVASGLASLAPNVRLETQTPGRGWQSDILGRTSLVITNGGIGSVTAALSAGVPLVVVPTTWDKPENARRVVEAGAGLQLSPRHCTPERLRTAVQRVLGEPSFRANAQRLAGLLGRLDGPSRAAELLEKLCAEENRRVPGELAAR